MMEKPQLNVPPKPSKKIKKTEPQKQEEIAGLEPQIAQEIKNWSRVWLQNFYDEHNEPAADFSTKLDFTKRAETHIAQLVGEIDSYNQGLLAPRYREGANVFLNSLIDFVEEKSADPENRTSLHSFVDALHEAMFSFSPNISNHIGLENLLITTAKATRVPESQGWFGQNMVGELTYELNWAPEDSVKQILDRIKKLSLSEQLDVIHQLATVGASAIAQGEPGDNAHDRIVKMLETINQESPYPIVKYATENSLITIEREEENPSLGVVTFRGNATGARLPEQLNETLTEQGDVLKRQIRIKNSPSGNYKILPISSDAVGLFDHSNTPRQFGTVEISSLPSPTKLNGLEIERLREGAEAKLNHRQFDELFIRVSNLLLRQDKEKRPTTSNILAKKWTEVSSQFSREEWKHIFNVILKNQETEENKAEKEVALREKIETKNLAASNRFVELVIEKGKQILATLPNPPTILRENYENLLRYHTEANEERAFASAEKIAKFFQIIQEFNPDNRHGLSEKQIQQGVELAQELQALRQFHINNWDEYNETRILQSAEQNPQLEAEIAESVKVEERLLEKQKELQTDILKYLQKLDQDLAKKLVGVEVKPYAQIETDPNLNPFPENERKQLTLLLQSLHNPALRNLVEADLEINLSEIPLRSQVHLLRFLSEQNHEGFNRLRKTLQTHPKISNKILNSFLAVAEDMQYGESILKLAEGLDEKTTEAVFSKYLEIVNTTEQIRQLTEQQSSEVVKNLLHKGNELLKSWAKATDKQDIKSILDQLEHIKAEVFLFASTFKALSTQEKIELTDLQGAHFEIKDSSALTEQEKQPMVRIFTDNRTGYPPELLKETLGEFKQTLQTPEHEFQILRFNDEMVAFIRFDKLPNGNLYAGSLNVRTEVRGSAIGSAMLHATLNKKAEEHNIEAVVYEKNPMLHRYIEDYGFKIVGEIENYKNTGQKFYKIEITKKQKGNQTPTSSTSAFSQAA